MLSVKKLVTPQLVVAFPEQRLEHLTEQIAAVRARYCAVLKPFTFRLVGLVNYPEMTSSPAAPGRILSELMRPPPSHQVCDIDSAEKVIDVLKFDPDEIVVVNHVGAFIGLITPDSFIRSLLIDSALSAKLKQRETSLSLRWDPYPLSIGKAGG